MKHLLMNPQHYYALASFYKIISQATRIIIYLAILLVKYQYCSSNETGSCKC